MLKVIVLNKILNNKFKFCLKKIIKKNKFLDNNIQ